jgi:pyruvate/2-oxoglutarate dehydrogenase complex dihydrolipoamide dehydrogenase (E3) component
VDQAGERFERNLVVIGAGAAGLVTSYIAAAVKAKVTLVEAGRMGGDCLNTGCVPSKALIRSAKFLSHLARAEEFGMRRGASRRLFVCRGDGARAARSCKTSSRTIRSNAIQDSAST